MKRILIVLLLLTTISCLYGLTILDSRLFVVNTHIDNYCLISMTPFGETLLEGMPFHIVVDNVQYNSNKEGRRIAEWSIEANMSRYELSFDAEPLTSTYDPEVKLGYILRFKYKENGIEKTMTVTVSSAGVVRASNAPSSALVSMHNDIYFMFDEDSTGDITGAPVGNYLASLTVTLTEL